MKNLSVSKLFSLSKSRPFTMATKSFFSDLFEVQPWKFSRFSFHVPVSLSSIVQINGTEILLANLAKLFGMSESDTITNSAFNVVHYTTGGHYAVHSDSGWPGHRPITVLVSLRVPSEGGETCFVPESVLKTGLNILDDAAYEHDCAGVLTALGAVCVSLARGDLLVWRNTWREEGVLEVPSPHTACPVRRGEKWVLNGWLTQSCKRGHIC